MKTITWITNHPKPLKGMWPRRFDVEYIEGDPKASDTYIVDELKAQNLIGVYIDIDVHEYRSKILVRSSEEYKWLNGVFASCPFCGNKRLITPHDGGFYVHCSSAGCKNAGTTYEKFEKRKKYPGPGI